MHFKKENFFVIEKSALSFGRVSVKCIFKKDKGGTKGDRGGDKRKNCEAFFRFEGKILKLRSFFKMRKKIFRSGSDFLFFGGRLNFFAELKNFSRLFVLLFLKVIWKKLR